MSTIYIADDNEIRTFVAAYAGQAIASMQLLLTGVSTEALRGFCVRVQGSITSLTVNDARLTDERLRLVATLQLTRLNITNYLGKPVILQALRDMPTLQYLKFCVGTPQLPSAIFSPLPALQTLNMPLNALSPFASFAWLRNYPELTRLEFTEGWGLEYLPLINMSAADFLRARRLQSVYLRFKSVAKRRAVTRFVCALVHCVNLPPEILMHVASFVPIIFIK